METSLVTQKAQRQLELLNVIYNNTAESVAAVAEYDKIRDELIEHYGGKSMAPVGYVDPDMAQVFSDVWKSEYGVRPSLYCSWQEADNFLARFRVSNVNQPS